VHEVRLQFADVGPPGQSEFVPILVVRDR
jgi:hypothetical protein